VANTPVSQRLLYRRHLLQTLQTLKNQPDCNSFARCLGDLQTACPEGHDPVLVMVAIHLLAHTTDETDGRHLSEIILALAELDEVQTPLWNIIANPQLADTAKDFAQLILQTLGDATPLSYWLANLKNPKILIDRETLRMLELVHQNPEAMVDFLDFFSTLPLDEQHNLMQSLWANCPSDNALNLVLNALALNGLPEASARLVNQALDRLNASYQPWSCYRLPVSGRQLVDVTTADTCYASLPDGLGHQIVMLVRKHLTSPHYCVVATVINDSQGILETFGFYSLSASEFWKLLDRTYEGCHKYPVPASLARHWLLIARNQTLLCNNRLPYEFYAWQTALMDIPEWVEPTIDPGWVRSHWSQLSEQLLDHPDLCTWIPDWSQQTGLSRLTTAHTMQDPRSLTEGLIRLQAQPHWLFIIKHRLERCAWLFHLQQSYVYRDLAATVSQTLLNEVHQPENQLIRTFLAEYIHRGIPKLFQLAEVGTDC
jgi:hypothetical protein